jgi:MFS family permease/HAMP domain-containing protein
MLATGLLLLAAIALTILSAPPIARAVEPEMGRTVSLIGGTVTRLLLRADTLQLPFDQLEGVGAVLDDVRRDNPNLAYLLVTDPNGRLLYASGAPDSNTLKARWRDSEATGSLTVGKWLDTAMPLLTQHGRIGTLHLGQPAATVAAQLHELFYDLVTVLVVATLTALELLRFVMASMVASPLAALDLCWNAARRGDFSHYLPTDYFGGIGKLNRPFNRLIERLNAQAASLKSAVPGLTFHAPGQRPTLFSGMVDFIRWPFFLLIFADSLSLSFFPMFVEGFYSPAYGLSKSVALGLPISLFMFAWAMAMPWAGLWCDRLGYRRAFAIGAGITTVGLMLTAASQTLIDLIAWRCLAAVGYGLVFVTAQTYIASHTPAERRTKGMAMFLATFFAGSLSGAAIGGILADRLGYRPTFLLSALLSLAAALFVLRFLQRKRPGGQGHKSLAWADIKLLLAHKPFVAITVLAAIPSKIALTGFLYYTAPLYLKSLGNSQSATGRVMMVYGLAIIVFSPFVAQMADKLGRHRWFVTLGGLVASAGMFVLHWIDGTLGVAGAVLLLGIGHAIGVSPQLALISDYCQGAVKQVGQATTTGIFRLIERLGNVLGPLLAGVLISTYGFRGAFYGIGLITLVCSVLFTLVLLVLQDEAAAVGDTA